MSAADVIAAGGCAPPVVASSGPVDVLAVMDDLIADMGDTPGTTGHQVVLARAAVAELIEADAEYDRARRAWDDGVYTEWDGVSDATREKVAGDFQDALARRAAALARAGGAA